MISTALSALPPTASRVTQVLETFCAKPPPAIAGCILVSSECTSSPSAYRGFMRGQVWANSEQLKLLIESVAENSPPAITDARGSTLLTNRELSLVQLVAEGRTNRDISRELHLSEHKSARYCREFLLCRRCPRGACSSLA